MDISNEKLIDMYVRMMRIRYFEEKVAELNMKGKRLGGHLYIGEEAVAVGVCTNLRDDDYITSTHRGHGHCIAKGADVKYMMAELYGKETGTNKGKGGSMHIADRKVGVLGANGVVGAGLPIATGAGLSCKFQKTDQVAVCFFGDGASNQGTFHESLNMAALWKLPVIYVCENNMYGMHTAVSKSTSVRNISVRAQAYDIPGLTVDGMNVLAVYEAASQAVDRARKGQGPTLLECKTYRFLGHSGPYVIEAAQVKPYRTIEEVNEWKKRDPIPALRNKLVADKVLPEEKAIELSNKVKQEVEDAVRFAEQSPDPLPEEAVQDVFVE
jgi:pyruvate dehydrogenase E1 component alpha subunit